MFTSRLAFPRRSLKGLAAVRTALFACWALGAPSASPGQIFRWDSNTLIPGTETTRPAPGTSYTNLDLSFAALNDKNLAGSSFTDIRLTNARLTNTNLAGSRSESIFNLTFADLTGVKGSGASFPGANFDYATGDFSQWQGAVLTQSRFEFSSWKNADFTGADLSGGYWGVNSSLKNANLTGANLTGANLVDTDLSGAKLDGAVIQGAYFDDFSFGQIFSLSRSQLYSTLSYQKKDLRGVSFRNSRFRNFNLSGQDLTGARFIGATLGQADFSGARIRSADFALTTAGGFTKQQLYSTQSWLSKDLTGLNLSGNDLSGWDFSGQNLSRADLSVSKLNDARFEDAEISGISLTEATRNGFTKEQLYSTLSYRQGNLGNIYLVRNDLSRWNFAGQDLRGATLFGSNAIKANFAGANFIGNKGLWQVDFTQANFAAAQLNDAEMSDSMVSGANLAGADLTGSRLVGLVAHDTNWAGAKLYRAELVNAKAFRSRFVGSDLSFANAQNANFVGANFIGANLNGAFLNGSALDGAEFSGAEIAYASFSGTAHLGFRKEQLYSTASYLRKDLRGIRLDSNDLSGWNFAGQDLRDASFFGVLTGANFSDATITGATFANMSADQLYSTASYQQKDLRDVRFFGDELQGWNFDSQDLSGAFFDVGLKDSTFNDAVVTRAYFRGFSANPLTKEQLYSTASYKNRDLSIVLQSIDASGWNFAGQNLQGTSFLTTNLTGADFTDAVLARTHFLNGSTFNKEQLYSSASYKNHDLFGVQLAALVLDGFNLQDLDLRYSSFNGSSLQDGTDFSRSDLRGSDLAITDGVQFLDRYPGTNVIQRDGKIFGLNLQNREELVIRNMVESPGPEYYWALPVEQTRPVVHEGVNLQLGSRLKFVLDERPWNSTISFQPGISTALAGTLELAFKEGSDPAAQIGQEIALFNWAGIERQGELKTVVPAGSLWDLSQLHMTGRVWLLALRAPGDADGDGRVDLADFSMLRQNFGRRGADLTSGDFTGDFQVDVQDFALLRAHFGKSTLLPEPQYLAVSLLTLASCWLLRQRKSRLLKNAAA